MKISQQAFLRYLFFFLLCLMLVKVNFSFLIFLTIACLLLYSVWAVSKNYKYVKNKSALLYLPILQLTSDVAVISGMTVGLMT